MSAVLVTYDQEAALSSVDWVGVMDDGHTNRMSKPQEVYRLPRTAFVAQFLGWIWCSPPPEA